MQTKKNPFLSSDGSVVCCDGCPLCPLSFARARTQSWPTPKHGIYGRLDSGSCLPAWFPAAAGNLWVASGELSNKGKL
jgi:hypothetical protein